MNIHVKNLLSASVVLSYCLLHLLPVQNSIAVNQLNDTAVSSAGIQVTTTLLNLSFPLAMVLLALIWAKEISNMIKKLILKNNEQNEQN